MDSAHNPFAPGAGSPPPALVGREPELTQFDLLITRLTAGRPERSIVLCGLRGMGKTVLLREMQGRAHAAGWRTSYLEARRGLDLRRSLGAQILEQLAGLSVRDRAKVAFERLLTLVKAVRVAAGPDRSIEVDPALLASLGHSLEGDIGVLLSRLGEFAREQGIGVAFFVDELQELDRDGLEALCAAMHRVGQEQLPVALVAAGLPGLPGQLAAAKSYAERLFSYPVVDRLDHDSARAALERPLPAGVAIEEDALGDLLAFADGYPLLLQLAGKQAWDVAGGPAITRDDVSVALPGAFDTLSKELFLARWQRATDRERDYLTGLAQAGGRGGSADVAKRGGFASITAAGPVRDTLIGKGLVWAPERGRVAFTMPLFERFILERDT